MPDLATNPSARHDFEFVQKFDGGLVLTGSETKAVKMGHAVLKGAFLYLRHGELFLKNAYIGPYAPAGPQLEDRTRRDRKVLLTKQELRTIKSKHEAERLTLVPISLYTSRSLVKISFALARGKKTHEKRETIKRRELDREIQRKMRE